MEKSFPNFKKWHLIVILSVAFFSMVITPGMAFDKINKLNNGIAIKGYDPVAYHTEGRAVKGNKNFSYKWNDAEWYFASAENRDLFAANPERYAPQYGGY